MTRKQIIDFLDQHNGCVLYAGVDGFLPRKVENYYPALVSGNLLISENGGNYIRLERPKIDSIGAISFVGANQGGFTVKRVDAYGGGYRLVFD